MNPKKFDCVEMKRKASERISRELQGKSVEEQVEYWRKVEEKYRNEDQEGGEPQAEEDK